MPGKKITDQQVRKYKAMRRQATQEIAAARMGISVRSARRIEKAEKLPSQHGPRNWRTRADPLAGVWEAELVPLLEAEPGLQGRTLFEELQRRHGERFGDGILRTLQRRVRAWRAEHGNEKEIYFAQANPPGRLALSDFTVCDSLAVIVAGDRFDLLVCDDFSYVRRDQAETSVLFELIAERYERRSIAITANQPFSGWDHVFAESAMTLAAVDRLVHHSTIFEMNVESFRRRSAQTGRAPSEQSKKPTSKTNG